MSGTYRMMRLLGIELPKGTKKLTYTPASLTATGHPGGYQELNHYALTIARVEPRADDPDHPDYVVLGTPGDKTSNTTRVRMNEAHSMLAGKEGYRPSPESMPENGWYDSPTGCNAERWHYDPSAPALAVVTRDLGDNQLTAQAFGEDQHNQAWEAYAVEFSERGLDTADRVTLYQGTCKRAEKTRKSEDHDAKTQARREARWKAQDELRAAENLAREQANAVHTARILEIAAELTAAN